MFGGPHVALPEYANECEVGDYMGVTTRPLTAIEYGAAESYMIEFVNNRQQVVAALDAEEGVVPVCDENTGLWSALKRPIEIALTFHWDYEIPAGVLKDTKGNFINQALYIRPEINSVHFMI